MSYSEPSEPDYGDYALYFRDAVSTAEAEQRTYFVVRLEQGASPPEVDTRAAFQRLVDLIADSTDFDNVSAYRRGAITQTVTPTPAPPD